MEAYYPPDDVNGGTEQMYRRLHASVPGELLDQFQIIPTRVRELDPEKKKILWIHDTHTDPEVEHLWEEENVERFERIVFVSYTQRSLFCEKFGLPYGKCVVIPNAIEPFGGCMKDDKGPVRLTYHTTPHRGLNILIPVFERIAEDHDVVLDVYSSFELYGLGKNDEMFKEMFDLCRKHPKIEYHGYEPNAVVRSALEKSHVFAYPCTWMETGCLAAIEALCSGNMVVCSDYGVLPETVRPYGFTYQYLEDPNEHASLFLKNLTSAVGMVREEHMTKYLRQQQTVMNSLYDWNNVSKHWTKLLRSLL